MRPSFVSFGRHCSKPSFTPSRSASVCVIIQRRLSVQFILLVFRRKADRVSHAECEAAVSVSGWCAAQFVLIFSCCICPFSLFRDLCVDVFLSLAGFSSITPASKLPTCNSVVNLFHPYDPLAYRLDQQVNPSCAFEPELIEHHKGRKRIHLGLHI